MDVHAVIAECEVIEMYPDDTPFPSRLVLGWIGSRPLNLVIADDAENETVIVITAYEPDTERWQPGFMRRKS